MFPSSTKREFRHFHVVVGQRRQRNVQKKRDARAKLLFLLIKPIAFLPFSLPYASSLLKLPNVGLSASTGQWIGIRKTFDPLGPGPGNTGNWILESLILKISWGKILFFPLDLLRSSCLRHSRFAPAARTLQVRQLNLCIGNFQMLLKNMLELLVMRLNSYKCQQLLHCF